MHTLTEHIDKLKAKLPSLQGDAALAAKLQLAKWYNYIDTSHTLAYSNEVMASTVLDPKNVYGVKAQLSAGIAMLSNRKVAEAIELLADAEQKAKAIGDKDLVALTQVYNLMLCPYNKAVDGDALIAELDNSGSIQNDLALKCQYHQSTSDYLREKDLQQASVHLFHALECSKVLNEPWLEGLILCKLGIVAERRQDDATAEQFYKDSLPLLMAHGCTQYVFQVYVCMSKLMIGKKEFEEAIRYAELSYKEAASINFKSAMDFALMHKATAMLWQKRLDEAEPLVHSIIAGGADTQIQGSLLNMLSNMYVQKDELQKGIDYALQSYELRKAMIRPMDEMTHNEKMYRLYVKVGNYKEALKHFELFHNRKLLLANENSMATMAEMQTKYDTEKKDAELQRTRLENIESELKALKAQMNPHFIFNSLNSIQEVFFTGDKRLANEHLSRFSQLMRNILRASSRQSLTLQEEINMMEEYLALEALRLGDTFSYNVTYDSAVDIFTMEIPPMILQPFIENSIKHGLQHKNGVKQVSINFDYDDNEEKLVCTISDNGIGRSASAIINTKRIGHQSFATSATSRRFDMLNSTREQKFAYYYIDNTDSEGNATGTTVHISLPIE